MNTRFLSLLALLALPVSGGVISGTTMAQSHAGRTSAETIQPSAAASAVGRWLHDPQGNTIGSVRSLADDGRTAVIMVGSNFQPGSYEARVPAGALSVVHGKVTLLTETLEALSGRSRSRGVRRGRVSQADAEALHGTSTLAAAPVSVSAPRSRATRRSVALPSLFDRFPHLRLSVAHHPFRRSKPSLYRSAALWVEPG